MRGGSSSTSSSQDCEGRKQGEEWERVEQSGAALNVMPVPGSLDHRTIDAFLDEVVAQGAERTLFDAKAARPEAEAATSHCPPVRQY